MQSFSKVNGISGKHCGEPRAIEHDAVQSIQFAGCGNGLQPGTFWDTLSGFREREHVPGNAVLDLEGIN